MTQTLILVALVFALAYLPLSSGQVSWRRSAIKTTPLLLFSLAAFLSGAPAFLVAGLFLSALGDFGLSRDGNGAFLYGLSAFALAHVLYIMQFFALTGAPFYGAFVTAPVAALVLLGVMISTELWLAPHTGALCWPVRAYVVIIGIMGLSALVLPFGITVIGAGLFILSDVILALHLFRMTPAHRHYLLSGYAVWGAYIAGQSLILLGGLG